MTSITSSEMNLRQLKFLIVDDFENFRHSLKQMLRSFGAEKIETAGNGRDAVQKCTFERFDVVLCDYNMGEGKDGQQVLEELRYRKLLRHTAIFAMVTAETSREMVMGAREQKPDTYITKPITRAQLEQRLQALLEQRQILYPVNHELDQNNPVAAIDRCNELLPRAPRHRNWLLKTLADLYYRTDNYPSAYKLLNQVLDTRDLDWARLGLARLQIAEHKWEEAINHLQHVIEKMPDQTEAYDLLAQAQQGQGRPRQAQKTLERALQISPRAIVRQQQLAQLSGRNHDLETAAQAWRNTVKLSDHSVHDSPDNFLNLGRCLADLSEGEDPKAGKDYAEEALKILQQSQRRFRDEPGVTEQSNLVAARVHAGQGQLGESRKLLDQVRAELDPATLDATTGLELARSLYALGDTGEAQALLTTLADRYSGEPDVIQEVESLLDEPVSIGKKLKARSANREGIAAFEAGQTDEALAAFRRALELVPQHPALNLNLVQVLLKDAESQPGGVDRQTLQLCQECLDRISHLPPQHRQYQRYQALHKKVVALVSNGRAPS